MNSAIEIGSGLRRHYRLRLDMDALRAALCAADGVYYAAEDVIDHLTAKGFWPDPQRTGWWVAEQHCLIEVDPHDVLEIELA